jgi:hypothetical protein
MRKRTLNPNASHSQAAAFVTSGYANTGITVARAIDLFESIISPPSGIDPVPDGNLSPAAPRIADHCGDIQALRQQPATALATYPAAPATRINLGLRFSLLTRIADWL